MDERLAQCKLVQGNTVQYAFIPVRGAKVGRHVELKDGSGWWTVEWCGRPTSKEEAIAMQNAHRTQRQASDI